MIKNIIKPVNIVADCDEILCNISPTWTRKILDNKEKFEGIMDFSHIENLNDDELHNKVLERPVFYLNSWLKKPHTLSNEEQQKIHDDFISLYDNKDFYLYMKPTEMGISLAKLAYTNMVKKIYVVTRCTENNQEMKKEFIKNLLPESKLEIRIVGSRESKSDYIRDIDMTEGIILEDELSNVHDYIDNVPTLEKINFYIPLLGYNHPNQDLYDKCKERNIELIYYPVNKK